MGFGYLLELFQSLIGCYYCEAELFGYSVLIKDSIACDKIVQLICRGVSQMNKVCMFETPGNQHFSIDVKGQSTKSYWIIKPPENERDDQYFILVYVPRDLTESPQYFILNSEDITEELKPNQERARQAEKESGKLLSHNFGTGGIAWDQPLEYKDKWGKLPN
jgi:hypothetical protein